MLNRIIFFLLFTLLFVACSKNEKDQFAHAGGTMNAPIDVYPSSFVPYEVIDVYSTRVLRQIYDGLVSIDPKSLEIRPRIAQSWTESPDGKQYQFIIRNNILFHAEGDFESEEDRLLTTEDIVYTIETICHKDNSEEGKRTYFFAFHDLLEGAKEFHDGKAKSISGLKVSGDTVTFNLIRKDHNFLYKLANVSNAILSKKAIELKITTPVGTGPFKFVKQKSDQEIILVKNQDFYMFDENQKALPYLDSVRFVLKGRKMEQLTLFEEGNIDYIQELPASRITKMLEGNIAAFNSVPPKLVLENNALLESNYYFFNLREDERFKDVKVRQAFNYAINRKDIGIEILRNQFYELGNYGVIPPVKKSIRGYDFKGVRKSGYSYDPEKARKLFAEAGYANGEGFGSVTLRFNINEQNSSVADEIAKQLNNVLNINVNIDGSSFEQLMDDYENGSGSMYRMSWSADFPSPETFLKQFHAHTDTTSSEGQTWSGYNNPIFNSFYEKAVESKKITEQLKYFNKAEIALMEDPPVLLLWYSGNFEISHSYLRNFYFNSLNLMDFTEVYIKPWTEEEYQKFLAEK